MAVVGGQLRADLVVADDRQVDEEAEHAGPQEVPEPDRGQEQHRPAMRELGLAAAHLLPRAQLQEGPGLDRQERQRDDLGRREERPQGHVDGRRAAEVQWCIVPTTPPTEYSMTSK